MLSHTRCHSLWDTHRTYGHAVHIHRTHGVHTHTHTHTPQTCTYTAVHIHRTHGVHAHHTHTHTANVHIHRTHSARAHHTYTYTVHTHTIHTHSPCTHTTTTIHTHTAHTVRTITHTHTPDAHTYTHQMPIHHIYAYHDRGQRPSQRTTDGRAGCERSHMRENRWRPDQPRV